MIISTIVDRLHDSGNGKGYKVMINSTIVDALILFFLYSLPVIYWCFLTYLTVV